ncbi:MAG: uracil-DNA glycosylase [Bdellovibrio sp.]
MNLCSETSSSDVSVKPDPGPGALSGLWADRLNPVLNSPELQQLKRFLQSRMQHKVPIYPQTKDFFRAFQLTPFERVRVVILGQDPYHNPGQAHGLCFSVPAGQRRPPSLLNIFKELHSDLGIPIPSEGDLSDWARQGVLLLNTVLSVEENKPGSHQDKGWEVLTDSVIRFLSQERENIVFVLWGSQAQKKRALIRIPHHGIIQSPHPSPLSAHRGFLGSRPFSQVNTFLKSRGLEEVDWRLE